MATQDNTISPFSYYTIELVLDGTRRQMRDGNQRALIWTDSKPAIEQCKTWRGIYIASDYRVVLDNDGQRTDIYPTERTREEITVFNTRYAREDGERE